MDGRALILWKGLAVSGHDFAQLAAVPNGWRLSGVSLLVHESAPCRLDYDIECEAHWLTQRVRIRGTCNGVPLALDLSRNSRGRWQANGRELPALDGCDDVDLEFSPSTNLLPIRRLTLPIGGAGVARAAWVRFPGLAVERLDQEYTRIDAGRYRYATLDGAFQRELTVNAAGFVLDYPGSWEAEGVTTR